MNIKNKSKLIVLISLCSSIVSSSTLYSESSFSTTFVPLASDKKYMYDSKTMHKIVDENKKLKVLLKEKKTVLEDLSQDYGNKKLNYLQTVNVELKKQITHYENQLRQYNHYVKKMNQKFRVLENNLSHDFEKTILGQKSSLTDLKQDRDKYKKLYTELSSKKTVRSVLNADSPSYILTDHEVDFLKSELKRLVFQNKKLKKNKEEVEMLTKIYKKEIKILKGKLYNLSANENMDENQDRQRMSSKSKISSQPNGFDNKSCLSEQKILSQGVVVDSDDSLVQNEGVVIDNEKELSQDEDIIDEEQLVSY